MDLSRVKTYLIKNENSNLIKIGKAVNPKKRLKQLQCGSSSKLEIIHIFDADIESILHLNFKGNRIHGEWFCIDVNDIIDFSKKICIEDFQQSNNNFIKSKTDIAKNCADLLIPKNQEPFNSFHFDYISMLKTCQECRLNPLEEVGMIIEIITDMDFSTYMYGCLVDQLENTNTSSSVNDVLFSALQRANTVYIEDGLSFDVRKDKLTKLFDKKHKQKLIDEIHRLEA